MREELGLSTEQMGAVFAVFAVAYGIFEIPGGWMGDTMGPRKVLTRIVVWWSAFTAFTGMATGYIQLLVIRFLFGAGEAGSLSEHLGDDLALAAGAAARGRSRLGVDGQSLGRRALAAHRRAADRALRLARGLLHLFQLSDSSGR